MPDAFQCAGFFQWRPQGSSNAEGLNVVVTGIGSSPGRPQPSTQIVQDFGFAEPAAEVTVQRQGLLLAAVAAG